MVQSWTFVVWGALNGLAVVIERVLGIGSDRKKRIYGIPDWKKAAKIIAFEDIRFSCRSGAHGAYLCFYLRHLGILPGTNIDQALYMLPRFLEGFDTFNLETVFEHKDYSGS